MPQQPAKNQFTYAEVETALARVFDIPDEGMKAFRGRLIHFQRLGMAPCRPGKGKRIAYTREDVFRWAVSLDLAAFGIEPTVIRVIVKEFWNTIRPHLLFGEDCDKYFFFHPFLLGKGPPKEQQIGLMPCYSVAAKVIGSLSEIDQMAKHASAIGRRFIAGAKARYGLIDLGHLRREVNHALAGHRL